MLIDKLLQADIKDLSATPTEEFEVERLSQKFGEPFNLTLQGIKTRKLKEIFDDINVSSKKNEKIDFDRQYEGMLELVLEGIVEPNFKDTRLLEKFHVPIPTDVIERMFLLGEIQTISEHILKLCGLDQQIFSQTKIDKEIKNS